MTAIPETTISDRLTASDRAVLSYEFFPPKSEKGLISLQKTVEGLAHTDPDFVTVTYGAGGSTQNLTFEVAELLRRFRFRPVMPHLTCVGKSRGELEEIADWIFAEGFRNIMTLRGDPPAGESSFIPPENGLSNALELVELLKTRHSEFCLGVAGYPETHPEAISAERELEYLKRKVDAGASFITTQLFLSNDSFYRFRDRCVAAGISVPILPGIMPALSLVQINRIASMCGAAVPAALTADLEKAGGDGEGAENAGILWCTQQIADLLRNGVPGIHLYIMNRVRPAFAFQLAQAVVEMTR